MQILTEIFDYFASDPLDPLFCVEEAAEDNSNSIYPTLIKQLNLIDALTIKKTKADKEFQFLFNDTKGIEYDYKARIWALKKILDEAIPKFRLQSLLDFHNLNEPDPYNHKSLKGISFDFDFLVPLSSFNIRGSALMRNGTGFTVTPLIEAKNSQYWLIQALLKENLQLVTDVRLDPFIVRKESEYPCMEYRMLVYGISLDWSLIEKLGYEDHGRWYPGKFSTKSAYTDYSWTPRDGEVHFRCEELPLKKDICTRGSRYLHGIYSPSKKKFVHLDGAIRIYTPDEWEMRLKSHVRNIGKIGKRVKIFRINKEVSRGCLGNISSNFFVWNYDVSRYFGVNIPEDF